MKTFIAATIAMVHMVAPALSHEIEIRAKDDDGNPISGANAVISFMRSGSGNSKVYRGITGEDGIFSARDQILIGAFVKVTKAGFYESVIESGFDDEDHKLDVVMRRIEAPVALIVREVNLAVPVKEELMSFDLAVGDWLPPFGKGILADLQLEFQNVFGGYRYSGKKWESIKKVNSNLDEAGLKNFYGKWDATLRVTFPTAGSGAVELNEGFVPYSGLTMPHFAPAEGYGDSLNIDSSTYELSRMNSNQKPLYLRTRVEKREDVIVRAHYVKLPDGISVDARGSLRFRYYFNPRENDRNLEFDPNMNLAEDQEKSFEP